MNAASSAEEAQITDLDLGEMFSNTAIAVSNGTYRVIISGLGQFTGYGQLSLSAIVVNQESSRANLSGSGSSLLSAAHGHPSFNQLKSEAIFNLLRLHEEKTVSACSAKGTSERPR
jgi:hypothetical protein